MPASPMKALLSGNGRYAPSPSGRMHLGNIFSALISWLSARSAGARWILRIEDLDPQRSKKEYAQIIEDDLHWLGLEWDEGGLNGIGTHGPYCQSLRHRSYAAALEKLKNQGITYPCFCSRADIMASQAPHQSDGRIVYAGTCRPQLPFRGPWPEKKHAVRIAVPKNNISFTDIVYGPQTVDLPEHCGDFVLQRADGAWAYQLAVVVDDADMEIGQVVRGSDLLLSSAQQIFLYQSLGLPVPQFGHVPLLCNGAGRRLSKRDGSLSMETLRREMPAQNIIGRLAYIAGLTATPAPAQPCDLIELFDWNKIPRLAEIRLH